MNALASLFRRDVRLCATRGGGALASLFFFVMTASLFAMAFSADAALLREAGAGVVLVSALLASLLSLEQVYHRDHDDGAIDMMLLSALSPIGLAGAKMAAHWAVTGLPLCLAALLVAQMLHVGAETLPVLFGAVMTGTVYMSVLGGFGAFLTLGAKRPGVLLAVVVLPLYVPMLLLGVMAAEAALAGMAAKPYLLLQVSLLVAALPLSVLASAGLLKMQLRSS